MEHNKQDGKARMLKKTANQHVCHQYILHIKFTMILSCCMQLKCSERTKIHIKLIFVNLTVSKLNVALCADISDKFKDSMATCSTHDFVPV